MAHYSIIASMIFIFSCRSLEAADLLEHKILTKNHENNVSVTTIAQTRWLSSSNIFASSSNVSDSYIETGLNISLSNDLNSTFFVDFTYSPTYRSYLKQSDLNSLDQLLTYKSKYSTEKSVAALKLEYSNTKQADRVIGANISLDKTAAEVLFQTEYSPILDVSAAYKFTKFRYQGINNSLRHALVCSSSYKPTEKLTLTPQLGLNSSENAGLKSDGQVFTFTSLLQPSSKMDVGLSLGYQRQQLPSDTLSAFTYDLSFTNKLTAKTSIATNIYRSANLSNYDFWQDSKGIRTSLLWQISLKSNLELSAEYERSKHIPLSSSAVNSRVSYRAFNATFRTKINNQNEVFLRASFDSQHSTNRSNTYKRKQILFGYNYTF